VFRICLETSIKRMRSKGYVEFIYSKTVLLLKMVIMLQMLYTQALRRLLLIYSAFVVFVVM